MPPEILPEQPIDNNKKKYTIISVVAILIVGGIVCWYVFTKGNNALPTSTGTPAQNSVSQAERNNQILQVVLSIPKATSSALEIKQIAKSIPKQTTALTPEEKTAIVQSIPPPTLQ